MLAFLDVQYSERSARGACVLASRWDAETPVHQWTREVSPIAPYQPGKFYLRELPVLLKVLEGTPPLEAVVIDGYVWLDTAGTPGLGARLYDALGKATPVIGVAKTAYQGSPMATLLHRPTSKNPLYITAAGIDPTLAAGQIGRLHGAARLPTMIRLVDRLARTG